MQYRQKNHVTIITILKIIIFEVSFAAMLFVIVSAHPMLYAYCAPHWPGCRIYPDDPMLGP